MPFHYCHGTVIYDIIFTILELFITPTKQLLIFYFQGYRHGIFKLIFRVFLPGSLLRMLLLRKNDEGAQYHPACFLADLLCLGRPILGIAPLSDDLPLLDGRYPDLSGL